MNTLTIDKIIEITNGRLLLPENYELSDKEASSFVIDSREVKEDSVFIASKGNKIDSHQFVNEVFNKGALACIVEEDVEDFIGPLIKVNNSFDALRKLATYYREMLSCRVIGITGSVGKTSTKECIAEVLSTVFKVHKTKANLNNEIGLPLTILETPFDSEVLVLEMGIDRFGDMDIIGPIAKPDVCVITNIGDCHLEYLESREGVFKEKTKIFNYMNKNGVVVLNGDDNLLKKIKKVYGKEPLRYGKKDYNDFKLDSFESLGYDGSVIKVSAKGQVYALQVSLPGEHMIYNILAAVTLGNVFNLEVKNITEGLAHLQAILGRGRVLTHNGMRIVDDTYNASPASVTGALELLGNSDTRKVAILGDMFELGDETIEKHIEIGNKCVECGLDLIIYNGDLMKNAYEVTKDHIESRWYPTHEDLLGELEGLLQPGDTVLLKASHGMRFDKIVDYLLQK